MTTFIKQQTQLGFIALIVLCIMLVSIFFTSKIRQVNVQGFHPHVSQSQLSKLLIEHKHRIWWLIDRQALSDQLEQLPWVKQADIQLRWPDTIRLYIQEYKPALRWNQQRIVSESSRVFPVSVSDWDKWRALPSLIGKPIDFQKFMKDWLYVNEQLRLHALSVKSIEITPWQDWNIQLHNGTQILLKNNAIIKNINKLSYFLKGNYNFNLYKPFRIDLRGKGGLAIRPL